MRTLGLRRTWDFITTENLGPTSASSEAGTNAESDSSLTEILLRWLDEAERLDSQETTDATASEDIGSVNDEAVFMKSFIPQSLGQVYNPERDVKILKESGKEALIYAGVTGLSLDNDTSHDDEQQDEGELSEGSVEGDEAEEAEGDGPARQSRGHRHEDKEAKKVCAALKSMMG